MDDNIEITGYTEYITEEHDTFDLIAYKLYGQEMLASVIIKANLDYADVLIFEAGVRLLMPEFEYNEMEATLPPWRTES